ncbi:MAG: hypothetical protein ABIF82_05160 [Planctomycetota bacterium]
MRTTARTTLLVILVASVFAAPSPAAESEIEGAGAVQAQGKGEVWAFGRGAVEYKMFGEGTLAVRNVLDNSISSDGSGTRTIEGTTVTYTAFKGTVTINGPSISANFEGGLVAFHGRGRGSVVLAGAGTYRRDDNEPKDWQKAGSTVLMGLPEDEESADLEDAEYEAQTVAVVEEIQTLPHYQVWASTYPSAAVVLVRTRRYYDWCERFPVAWAALHSHRGWSVWVSARPFVSVFLANHDSYVTWRRTYPVYGVYLRHPHAYYLWRTRYPEAYVAVSVRVSHTDWARTYPAAAHRLTRRVAVKPTAVQVRKHSGTQIYKSSPARPIRIEKPSVSRPAPAVGNERRSNPVERRGDSSSSVNGSERPVLTPERRAVIGQENGPSKPVNVTRPQNTAAPRENSVSTALAKIEDRFEKKQAELSKQSEKLDSWNTKRVEQKNGDAKGLAQLQEQYAKKQAKLDKKAENVQVKYDRRVAKK